MPIRFRCTFCKRLLGIATRKAGTDTVCPHCGSTITVPTPTEEEAQTERINLDDVDEMMGNGATERESIPKTQVVQPAPPLVPAISPRLPADPPRAAQAKAEPRPNPPPVPKAASAIRPLPPTPRPAPPPVPKAAAKPPAKASDEPPLFEGDMDAILGKTAVPAEADRPRVAPTSGPDALSLGDPPRMLVISATKATLLMGAVVVLLALAFAAGYYIAHKG